MPMSLEKIELEAMLLLRHMSLMTSRRDRNLDRSAYMVLSCLMFGGAMTIAQLGEAMGLDGSTLNRQTSAMLDRGLLERIPDPAGGVARKYHPTESGIAGLVAACTANMAALRTATADWKAGELEAFGGYLERFNQGLEELENLTWPRPTSTSLESVR